MFHPEVLCLPFLAGRYSYRGNTKRRKKDGAGIEVQGSRTDRLVAQVSKGGRGRKCLANSFMLSDFIPRVGGSRFLKALDLATGIRAYL
jgi:hypothetical protein